MTFDVHNWKGVAAPAECTVEDGLYGALYDAHPIVNLTLTGSI